MLFDILICALGVYVLYQLLKAWLIVNEIKSSVAETVSILQEQSKFRMISFEQIEQNGYNVILCYDNENNFIAQGATKDEVVEIARQRYPNQNLATYKTEELQWIKPESEKNSTNG